MNMAIITMNTDALTACPSPVIEITDASFEEHIGRSPTPVLLAFYMSGCSACQKLLVLLDAAAPRCGGFAMIATADMDEVPELAARFGIVSVPAVLLFNGGTVGYQFIGDLSRHELDELLARAVTNRSPVAQYH
jgi:thioredoxin 1